LLLHFGTFGTFVIFEISGIFEMSENHEKSEKSEKSDIPKISKKPKKSTRPNPRRRKALNEKRRWIREENFWPIISLDIMFVIFNYISSVDLRVLNDVCKRSRELVEKYRDYLEKCATKEHVEKFLWLFGHEYGWCIPSDAEPSDGSVSDRWLPSFHGLHWRDVITDRCDTIEHTRDDPWKIYCKRRAKAKKRAENKKRAVVRMLHEIQLYVDVLVSRFIEFYSEKIRKSCETTKTKKTLKKPKATFFENDTRLRHRRLNPNVTIPRCIKWFGEKPGVERKKFHQPSRPVILMDTLPQEFYPAFKMMMRKHGPKIIKSLKKMLVNQFPFIIIKFTVQLNPSDPTQKIAYITYTH